VKDRKGIQNSSLRPGREQLLVKGQLKLKEAKDITFRRCFPWQPGCQFLQFLPGIDPWLCAATLR